MIYYKKLTYYREGRGPIAMHDGIQKVGVSRTKPDAGLHDRYNNK